MIVALERTAEVITHCPHCESRLKVEYVNGEHFFECSGGCFTGENLDEVRERQDEEYFDRNHLDDDGYLAR